MTPILSLSPPNLTSIVSTTSATSSSWDVDTLMGLVFGIVASVTGILGVLLAFSAIRKAQKPPTPRLTIPMVNVTNISLLGAPIANNSAFAFTTRTEQNCIVPIEQLCDFATPPNTSDCSDALIHT